MSRHILRLVILTPFMLVAGCGGGGGNASPDPDIVGTDGGTVALPGNITLNFPPNAFIEDTRVSAVFIDSDTAQLALDSSGNRSRRFLGGLKFEPSGPLGDIVEITFPLETVPADDELPIHYFYDHDVGAYYPGNTVVTISPEAGTATLYLDEFSDHVIAGVKEVNTRQCKEIDPCRCGDFTVTETSRDLSFSKQDCQASDVSGKIVYHECGDLTESWIFAEHTQGCVPTMSLTIEDSVIAPGESTQVEATVNFLTEPVPDLGVGISADQLVILRETSLLTDLDGKARTTVTAQNVEGVATVDASATMTYASSIIALNGVEESVVERTRSITASTDVIVGIPDWTGNLTLEFAQCMGYLDMEATKCIGAQYSFSVSMEFVLTVDELNSNPNINNPNLTGLGSVTFSPVQIIDGPIRDIPDLSCATRQQQEFFDSVQTFPFTAEIIGLQAANAAGPYDLLLHFNHPSPGLGAVIANFDIGIINFCDGIVVDTIIEPDFYQLYWNPGIEHDWDPLWADDFGYRLDLAGGEDVIFKTGQCGGFYNGEFDLGPYEKCNYTLNLMKM